MEKALFQQKISDNLMTDYRTTIKEATVRQLHNAVSRAAMSDIIPLWNESEKRHNSRRRAYYLSAEFLMGRAVYNNLYCAG
ncbi:MAG: glycogen phosphorylase, partial [Oscillospiraceae bacterium]|nr:glycogen phosphorylase [Oscillospiraceae bacterium]